MTRKGECPSCGHIDTTAAERIAALEAAIADIEGHATPIAQDTDGFNSVGYTVSIGSLHRALGVLVGASYTGSFGAQGEGSST